MHLISGGFILGFELDDADTSFNESGVSWEITDAKLFASLHTIGPALVTSYASHILKREPSSPALATLQSVWSAGSPA